MALSFASHIGRARRVSGYFREIFRYRLAITERTDPLTRATVFIQSCVTLFFNRKNVLFFPDLPQHFFVIYKIFMCLGFHLTTDPTAMCDIAVKWRNTVGTGDPFLPPEQELEKIARSRPHVPIVNMDCHDVSKERVSAVFLETFGYSLSVDPSMHIGKCVMKSNWNGLHEGKIIDCPTSDRRDGFVYERLINNEVEAGLVEDIRVPVFKDAIPFVYLKYRPVLDRLVDRSHINTKIVMAEVCDVLSDGEIEAILMFCRNMGLDYGEIDVLRDRDQQRIYIVDVNNDPAGPPSPLSSQYSQLAIVRLAKAFEERFISA